MAVATVELRVPCELRYRGLVLATCSSMCQLMWQDDVEPLPAALHNPFIASVLSAISEVFNNIVRHTQASSMRLTLQVDGDCFSIETEDHGVPFEYDSQADPDVMALPESGLGLFIARRSVDTLDYTPGPPNRWLLVKRRQEAQDR